MDMSTMWNHLRSGRKRRHQYKAWRMQNTWYYLVW